MEQNLKPSQATLKGENIVLLLVMIWPGRSLCLVKTILVGAVAYPIVLIVGKKKLSGIEKGVIPAKGSGAEGATIIIGKEGKLLYPRR